MWSQDQHFLSFRFSKFIEILPLSVTFDFFLPWAYVVCKKVMSSTTSLSVGSVTITHNTIGQSQVTWDSHGHVQTCSLGTNLTPHQTPALPDLFKRVHLEPPPPASTHMETLLLLPPPPPPAPGNPHHPSPPAHASIGRWALARPSCLLICLLKR